MKIIYALFFVLMTNFIFSQWNSNPAINNTICVQTNKQTNPKMTSDLKGGAIIVWEDFRNDTSRADIFVQRISNGGTAMWTTHGVGICVDTNNQASPVITTDSIGGAIIVWEDKRSGKKNLYAQRIDSSGTIQWASNGVGVNLNTNNQGNAKLLPDGNKGAIIVWQDSIGTSYGIVAQRLNAAGVPQWAGGSVVSALPFSQSNPKAQISTAGEIFITWQDKRNGADFDVFVQKLNFSGAPQWLLNGINLTNFGGTQSNPKIVLDNSGGVVVVWQDKRTAIDYDVYAQRINAAGVIQWAANGIGISVAVGGQTAIDITSQSMTNNVVIAWKDARAGLNNIDIYAQSVNLAGVVQWPTNGLLVANGIYNQINPNVTGDGVGGSIIAYQDSSAGNWDIRSQHVSQAGTLLWNAAGANVGIATGHQINHNNIGLLNGNSVYAFQDSRYGNKDIFAYKLDALGNPIAVIPFSDNRVNINVFPNPSTETVMFHFPGMGEHTNLILADASGNEIFSEEVTNADFFELKFKPKAGIYFYTIVTKNSSYKGKLIILN